MTGIIWSGVLVVHAVLLSLAVSGPATGTSAPDPQSSTTQAKPAITSFLQTVSVDPVSPVTVVYSAKSYFEAPNWSRDGKRLVFDEDGRMMAFDLVGFGGGIPHVIDTGTAGHCNGSHGLSHDGQSMAITCTMGTGNEARIYIVPLAGGAPREVTANPYSYFHGWSPDGKTIVFARPSKAPDGTVSIAVFSISADGGPETDLTPGGGINDDPDFSADGKYIYFNSDRGGKAMEIWRMKPDGSAAEQVTSDEMNNWSPHPSPDGKWIAFLSYGKGVSGHLANKQVSLRVMSLADKKIIKVADLVGGSGSMNVNSWSPDSKHLAFVGFKLETP